MASLKQYSLIFGVIGGTLLAEEQEIDVERTTNSQPVATVLNGYSGESPGAAMMTVDVQNAVPSAGFEFDAGQSMLALIPVSVQVIGPGGKSAKAKAFIIKDSLKHGVNQEAKYSFSARMPMSLFT
jgi:hypothetical protein